MLVSSGISLFLDVDDVIVSVTIHFRLSGHGEDDLPKLVNVSLSATVQIIYMY